MSDIQKDPAGGKTKWTPKARKGKFTDAWTFHDEKGALFAVSVFGSRAKEEFRVIAKIAASPRMYDTLVTIANVGSGEAKRLALEVLREIDNAPR